MKRKPLLFAIALLFSVGAALWGVNYRLDHPPLTKADKEFRALVADVDGMRVSQLSFKSPTQYKTIQLGQLNGLQTREFIGQIRLVDSSVDLGKVKGITLNFLLNRQGRELDNLNIVQNPNSTQIFVADSNSTWHGYQVNPRFNKRLNRALNAYLPQRVRP